MAPAPGGIQCLRNTRSSLLQARPAAWRSGAGILPKGTQERGHPSCATVCQRTQALRPLVRLALATDLQGMLEFLALNGRDHLQAAVNNTPGVDPRVLERSAFSDGLSEAESEHWHRVTRGAWADLRHRLPDAVVWVQVAPTSASARSPDLAASLSMASNSTRKGPPPQSRTAQDWFGPRASSCEAARRRLSSLARSRA
jgi:hypothetical protein